MIAAQIWRTPVPPRNLCHKTLCFLSLTLGLRKTYLQERIRPTTPGRRQPGQPIFPVDGLPRAGMFLRRQNTRQRRHLRPSQFPPDSAGSNCHLWIVANTLRLAHIAAGHHVKLVAVFAEPYGRCDFRPTLAERAERDVFLAADFCGDRFRHRIHCKGSARTR
jgi:hypothetical protein